MLLLQVSGSRETGQAPLQTFSQLRSHKPRYSKSQMMEQFQDWFPRGLRAAPEASSSLSAAPPGAGVILLVLLGLLQHSMR